MRVIYVLLCCCLWFSAAAQSSSKIVVHAGEPKAVVQPTMWGVFFEDINFGADGGIYAELIKNRSFEFFKPMMGWKVLGAPQTEGDFLVVNRRELNTANPRFLHVTLHQNGNRSIGLNNEGFRNMGVKKDLRYDFSLQYRRKGDPVKVYIELVNEQGESLGGTTITAAATNGEEWKKQTASFTATATEPKASFNIWLEGDGVIDLDMLSLFPGDTWKKRPGGLRADMIQLLADMKPGFLRFPGGCIVEGFDLSQRYQWKKTIGPVEERQLLINRWNYEFSHRPAPDYFQTFGLGFFEYFQLAEDIGAEPLPILNAGMACQFNSGEVVPMDQLGPFVQDALDLIEFANGDVNTVWGKKRAEMGHPVPFGLKMVGIGNENWGPQYIERLKVFTGAIKAKYPEIRIVNSAGTDPNGARYEYLNKELRQMNADIIDEHYYRRPEWFLQNARRYDTFPRNGSKIFGGEYAAQSDKTVSINNKNNWQTALAEAAFMTGLERNADVVVMASYAPLFAHVDGWQWTPDLIWADNLGTYGTPNYYVQKLFSLNKGTDVVAALTNNQSIAGEDSLYVSAVLDKMAGELVVKLVNVSGSTKTREIDIAGIKKADSKAILTVLKSADLGAMNPVGAQPAVSPVVQEIAVKGKAMKLMLDPCSFTVARIKLN